MSSEKQIEFTKENIDTYLKEVAKEYPGKTIGNIIAQLEARRKEISNSATE